MSYHKMSIYSAISEIDSGRMFLPALQRRFVWKRAQIELLFDSIMRGYPFGTFLFWKLAKDKANENYVFYEFKKSYDERTPFNDRKEGAFTPDHIIGVLDGQQRLSSIYIGLQGSHIERGYRKRKSSPDAYQKAQLYLNLLSLPYRVSESRGLEQDETQNFEFRFLTRNTVTGHVERHSQEDRNHTEFVLWFNVAEIMRWPKDPDLDHYIDSIIGSCTDQSQAKAVESSRRIIRSGLNTLYRRIHEESLISYFEVSKDDLEDILKIFVRVNSGGTILSKTDLLFSTIVATWDNGREEIEELQKTINAMGLGFNFGTEYLMRCCLVLSDGPVLYKVHSFKAENVQAIREKWKDIAAAITKTVDLLVEFGFSEETLTSNNATIPIVYYIYKGGSLEKEPKSGLRSYLTHALLKRLFGSSQDQLLNHLRGILRKASPNASGQYVLRDDYKIFNFTRFADVALPSGKSLKVNSEDIDQFLSYRKGPAAFSVLQLLYPKLRYRQVSFHQDHMHPASRFNKDAFSTMQLDQEDQDQWIAWRDQIPNLQLMDGRLNQSKNATPLSTWLDEMDDNSRQHFLSQNYFPPEIDISFKQFPAFFKARRELLRSKLNDLLYVLESPSAVTSDDEIERVSDEDMELVVFSSQDDEVAP
jgi:hypothetical protein